MFLSKILLGLASLSLIAVAGLPALADSASTRQSAIQDTLITGDGNRATSRSRQRATVEQSGSGQDASATSQTVIQTTTITGDNNSAYSSSRQTAVVRQGRR